MSKQQAAPQAGGEPLSRARATNTAPSRGAPRDGAPIRAVRWSTAQQGGPHGPEQPPGHGGAEDATSAKTPPRPKPSYVPPSQRGASSRSAVDQQPPHYGSVGLPGAPPRGSSPPATATLKEEDGTEAAPESNFHGGQPSPMILPPKLRKRQPMAFCFTACCVLFWLLVIAVGVAMLVVYLIYRPQPPRLRVTSATLNAGYINELGGGGMALNYDLTVLAAISNPNTMIHIVLYYMQLDLYFQGSLIGTQALWPAPLHEGPGGSVLRSVHLVVSEVTITQEDVRVWQNATAKGRPVKLHLHGRFHTQLNFGRWLPFKYWVSPRCTLWLDPPPSGALRRARC